MTASPADRFTISAPHGSFVVQDDAHAIYVFMSGEFDVSSQESALSVIEEVGELLGAQPRPVIVDMADLEFFDAAGIRFVLSLDRIAQLVAMTACVRDPKPHVHQVFVIVELERFLTGD